MMQGIVQISGEWYVIEVPEYDGDGGEEFTEERDVWLVAGGPYHSRAIAETQVEVGR